MWESNKIINVKYFAKYYGNAGCLYHCSGLKLFYCVCNNCGLEYIISFLSNVLYILLLHRCTIWLNTTCLDAFGSHKLSWSPEEPHTYQGNLAQSVLTSWCNWPSVLHCIIAVLVSGIANFEICKKVQRRTNPLYFSPC